MPKCVTIVIPAFAHHPFPRAAGEVHTQVYIDKPSCTTEDYCKHVIQIAPRNITTLSM